jgi:hypothetical protein
MSSSNMNTSTQAVVDNALARKRERLAYKTSTSHEDLKQFISDVLKQYKFNIIVPGVCDELDDCVPSSWPNAKKHRWVLNALMEAGAKAGKWEQDDKEKARDKLDGHCDEMAFCLTNTAVKSLVDTGKLCFDHTYRKILTGMYTMKPKDVVSYIFKNWLTGQNPWNSVVPVGSSTKSITICDTLWGGNGLAARVVEITKVALIDKAIYAIPVYLLLYIFDETELTDNELTTGEDETAQYSIHAVGLIVDGPGRTAYICDPNGGVFKNGNYEFLTIPLERREKITTCVSQSNLDAAVQPAT